MTASANAQRASAGEIFAAAVKLDEGPARQALVEMACQGDEDLLAQVQALLAADTQSGNALEAVAAQLVNREPACGNGPTTTETFITDSPVADDADTSPPLDLSKHPQIGPYKLLQQIGEGGFGVVYLAEQTKPVRRKVALKVIKPGMDSKEVLARFEAERQALAMMDHPNVAKVLDAGTSESGRPYFVMELVRGVPITEFCDENKLSTRERLELFLDVGRAVQHAHQKGIIHRDLKPSNVLITMNDDRPMPKVIDFGISKALSGQLTEKTLFTAYDQMVGTPLYMSPEQAQFSANDVDTRSDVYSLGVLLYELLTGSTPFDKETLQKSGFDDMRRIIRDVDPPRPSARVSTLHAEALSTVSSRRKIEATKLGHSLRGELDWIVMKALEKDRTRRYESASAFAADIQRYLDDEAVLACPPSMGYRLRKYARRHKGLLTSAGLVSVLMVASTIISAYFAIQANAARHSAEASGEDANEQKAAAIAAREVADERLKQSRADVTRALQSLEIVVEAVSSYEFGELPAAREVRETTFEQAMEFYDAIIEEHDNSPEARMHQAIAHLHLQRISEADGQSAERYHHLNAAIEILEQLVADYPDDQRYRARLAKAFFRRIHLNRLTDVQKLAAAERALELHQQVVTATGAEETSYTALLHLKVARFLPLDSMRAQHHIDESLRITESLGIGPLPLAHALAARRAIAEGDLDAAIASYIKASETHLERAPGQPRPWVSIVWAEIFRRRVAELQEQQRNFGNAEESYRAAIEIGSSAARKYSQVSWIRGELADSVRDCNIFLDSQGRQEEADEFFDTIVEEFPTFEELHDRNARRLDRSDDAIVRLSRAIKTHPGEIAYLIARSRLLIESGDLEQARADLDTVIAEEAGYYTLYQAALLSLATKAPDRYRELCQGMLSEFADSDNSMETQFTAWTCALAPEALDDYAVALAMAESAVATEPENQQHLNALGAIQFRAGLYEKALATFDKAATVSESGKTSSAYDDYFRAMAEHALERPDAARQSLATANELATAELENEADPPAWNRKLTLELLRAETEALIGPLGDEQE